MEDLSWDALDPCDVSCQTTSSPFAEHELELTVQRELLAQPGLDFASLVVRRIPGGVCLEGVLETSASISRPQDCFPGGLRRDQARRPP
jgi:hypothetical protein